MDTYGYNELMEFIIDASVVFRNWINRIYFRHFSVVFRHVINQIYYWHFFAVLRLWTNGIYFGRKFAAECLFFNYVVRFCRVIWSNFYVIEWNFTYMFIRKSSKFLYVQVHTVYKMVNWAMQTVHHVVLRKRRSRTVRIKKRRDAMLQVR
jgi:hypothetical protein